MNDTLQHILYVDKPDLQAVSRIALEIVGGFEPRVCSSGEEAIEETVGFASVLFLT